MEIRKGFQLENVKHVDVMDYKEMIVQKVLNGKGRGVKVEGIVEG